MAAYSSQNPQGNNPFKKLVGWGLSMASRGDLTPEEAEKMVEGVQGAVERGRYEAEIAEQQGGAQGRGTAKVLGLVAAGGALVTWAYRVPFIKQALAQGLEIAANVTGVEAIHRLAGFMRDQFNINYRPSQVAQFMYECGTPQELTALVTNGHPDEPKTAEAFHSRLKYLGRYFKSAAEPAIWSRIESTGDMEDCRLLLGAMFKFNGNLQAIYKRSDSSRAEPFARALTEYLSETNKLGISLQSSLGYVKRYITACNLQELSGLIDTIERAGSYGELEDKHLNISKQYLNSLYQTMHAQGRTQQQAGGALEAGGYIRNAASSHEAEPAIFLHNVQLLVARIRDIPEQWATQETQVWQALESVAKDTRLIGTGAVASGILHVRAQINASADPQDQVANVKAWAADYDNRYGLDTLPPTFIQTALRIAGAAPETLRIFRQGTVQQMQEFVRSGNADYASQPQLPAVSATSGEEAASPKIIRRDEGFWTQRAAASAENTPTVGLVPGS